MVADATLMTERMNGLRSVLKQRLLEIGIGPGLRNDARADVGTNLGLIGLNDGVERGWFDISLFGQDGLQRAHAQLRLGQLRVVVVMMVMMVVIVAAHGPRISAMEG